MVEESLDLSKIKARYSAATTGPWTLRREEPDVYVMSGKTVIASTGDFYPEAEFIAHARTDIPLLVTALEEAQRALQTLRTLAVAAEAGNAVLGDARAAGKTLPKHIREVADAILGESK